MKAEPTAEHGWLQQLVGEWTVSGEFDNGPGQPPGTSKGSETVRSLGGLWVVCEGRFEMGGEVGTALMTLGYDPAGKRYTGTWVGSMMTHLWVYDGRLDEARRVLTLEAEGPSMANPGATAKYRDVIELKGSDERTLTSHLLGEDGKWTPFMTARYVRTA